jgi:hypothetical protein
MNTYVLGAGASRHADYPLTSELGPRLRDWVNQNWVDGVLGLNTQTVNDLCEYYEGLTDLEQILTDLYERPVGSKAAALEKSSCGAALTALRVAIPEFFNSLQQAPIRGPDLYLSLAQNHVHKGDAVVTFNYDLAVERALRTAGLWEIGDGYGFSLGDDITPSSQARVLKVHGSKNWLGLLFGGGIGFSQASSVYGPRPVLFRESDFAFLGYSKAVRDPHSRGIGRTGGEPALILPTLHKNFFNQTHFGHEWEPFWNLLWSQAANSLQSSARIVIIGYSLPPADERARELLLTQSNKDAEVHVFCGSRTAVICEAFREAGFRTVKTSEKNHRFEDFLSL